ncbi:MAG: ECF transporter S component [Oscillospiraceae bacterium]|nr:ECF transporter S component [Oscillospiraceae bacterium]
MKTENVKRMVGIALLIAIIVVVQLLCTAFPIKIGPVSISLVLVPIVIGAALYGPGGGAILGAAFSVVAVVCCINGMDGGGAMVFQANPLLCILVVMLKGTLAGAVSGWVYQLLSEKNSYIALLCAAIVCPVVNTGVFLIGMALFFMDVLRVWAGGSDVVGYIITGLVLINFLPELLLNILMTPASQRILRVVRRNS